MLISIGNEILRREFFGVLSPDGLGIATLAVVLGVAGFAFLPAVVDCSKSEINDKPYTMDGTIRCSWTAKDNSGGRIHIAITPRWVSFSGSATGSKHRWTLSAAANSQFDAAISLDRLPNSGSWGMNRWPIPSTILSFSTFGNP